MIFQALAGNPSRDDEQALDVADVSPATNDSSNSIEDEGALA
jgi:hypothetical protein